MDSIHIIKYPANEIFKKYSISKEKFKDRYICLMDSMKLFIEKAGLSTYAYVNDSILGNLLVSYFINISKLKNYNEIKHANSIKIVSYISYWIIKAKPIQLKATGQNNYLLDLNEKFALVYIFDFLSNSNRKHILDYSENCIRSFKESLLYFLKNELNNPEDLEIMILGFFAGQIYENPSLDGALPPSDAE